MERTCLRFLVINNRKSPRLLKRVHWRWILFVLLSRLRSKIFYSFKHCLTRFARVQIRLIIYCHLIIFMYFHWRRSRLPFHPVGRPRRAARANRLHLQAIKIYANKLLAGIDSHARSNGRANLQCVLPPFFLSFYSLFSSISCSALGSLAQMPYKSITLFDWIGKTMRRLGHDLIEYRDFRSLCCEIIWVDKRIPISRSPARSRFPAALRRCGSLACIEVARRAGTWISKPKIVSAILINNHKSHLSDLLAERARIEREHVIDGRRIEYVESLDCEKNGEWDTLGVSMAAILDDFWYFVCINNQH